MKTQKHTVNYCYLFIGLVVGILLIFSMAWIAKDAVLPANSEEQFIVLKRQSLVWQRRHKMLLFLLEITSILSQQATQIPGFPPFFGRQYGYSDNQGIDLGELDQEPQLIAMDLKVIYKVEGDFSLYCDKQSCD